MNPSNLIPREFILSKVTQKNILKRIKQYVPVYVSR